MNQDEKDLIEQLAEEYGFTPESIQSNLDCRGEEERNE